MSISFEQLKLALSLHNIQRFQTHRIVKPKSVAEHSFRVAAIYTFLGGKDYLAALFHDIEESITGDIPGPVKPLLQGLQQFESLRPVFSNEREKQICKVADKMELVLDLGEQCGSPEFLPAKLLHIYENEYNECIKLASEVGVMGQLTSILKDLL